MGGQLVATMRAMAWHWKAVEGVLDADDGAHPGGEADPAADWNRFAEHQMLLMAAAVAPTSSH